MKANCSTNETRTKHIIDNLDIRLRVLNSYFDQKSFDKPIKNFMKSFYQQGQSVLAHTQIYSLSLNEVELKDSWVSTFYDVQTLSYTNMKFEGEFWSSVESLDYTVFKILIFMDEIVTT